MTEAWRAKEVEPNTLLWKSKDRSFDEGRLEVTYSHVQLCAVTCSTAKDVEHASYPNLSKNTIKIKRSSFFLSLFVNAVGWSSLLLFEKLSGLDCRSSHWWRNVNSRRIHGQLVRMVLVEQADELSEMLDRWSWLPGILFLWISFL